MASQPASWPVPLCVKTKAVTVIVVALFVSYTFAFCSCTRPVCYEGAVKGNQHESRYLFLSLGSLYSTRSSLLPDVGFQYRKAKEFQRVSVCSDCLSHSTSYALVSACLTTTNISKMFHVLTWSISAFILGNRRVLSRTTATLSWRLDAQNDAFDRKKKR